jgi:hypothetical protein
VAGGRVRPDRIVSGTGWPLSRGAGVNVFVRKEIAPLVATLLEAALAA